MSAVEWTIAEVRDFSSPVTIGRTGDRVAVLLDAEHADQLAKILALVETLTADGAVDVQFHFDPDVWIHALFDLLRQATLIREPAPLPVYATAIGVAR